jgi:hypothetical protein
MLDLNPTLPFALFKGVRTCPEPTAPPEIQLQPITRIAAEGCIG